MRSLLLVLLPLVASAQTNQPPETSTLQGRVLNAVTGEPVRKAIVQMARIDRPAFPVSASNLLSALTDGSGTYSIPNIEPGAYRIRATRTGYLPVVYGARGSQQSGTTLDLGQPQQLKGIDIRLIPQGVIAGRVLDEDGEPREEVQIQILRSQYVNGKKVFAVVRPVYTNDLGEYRWAGLNPGKYFIYAEIFGSGLQPVTGARDAYVPIYYPGVTNIDAAVPFDVIPGAQIRVPDLLLHKAAALTLKGRVVIEAAGTVGVINVSITRDVAHDSSGAFMSRSERTKVTGTGEFEASSLTPGKYRISASAAVGGTYQMSPVVKLEVSAANVEGVILPIRAGQSITGAIRVEAESAPLPTSAGVKFRPGGPTEDFSSNNAAHMSNDGSFRDDNNPPGLYGATVVGLPDGFYTKSIRMGDREVLYSGFELGSSTTVLDVVISPKAGAVSGVVQDEKAGKPAGGATVVIVPKEKERLGIGAYNLQANSDQLGRFTFKSVPPGKYEVFAWQEIEPTAWMDPEFMKSFAGKGESAEVEESSKISIQVNLIPAATEQAK